MPVLYVVATPIGNLGDMSPRAVKILKSVDLIAAEDTRVTAKLCQVFDIHTPLTSCHRHNEDSKGSQLADRMLSENLNIAVTTDAGTPCVSDPGYALVQACWERGIEIQPIPGCSAGIAALSVCGFDTREFAFYGFLPREKKELREKLREIAKGVPIAILHESPYRIIELTETILEVLPGAMLTVCCDLTKLHEKSLRGTPVEVLETLRGNPKTEKGEYCLVMDLHGIPKPEEENQIGNLSMEAKLIEIIREGADLREAQEVLIRKGEKKNAVKQAALFLKKLEL